ncbi:cytochrome c oxidase subunit II [Nocardioides currus]|uniref:cytochrome-c oxidase n=1 Tax=Nocardioides currus TaxID=2133958 RepID=A0A2R7YWE5_9ACTN|nr:cytochrome c oxidase subunit II [Nocardioides currus]PUA80634.1 cytochrome c oxidase subunit II [Nocardioides currus]
MGLQLPKRAAAPARRLATGALLAATLLFLSACDAADKDQIARLAMPEPATSQSPATFELWKWAWVAAMVTGVIVWALIFWVVVKYRRRNDDEIPVQTRYNLPLEIFYTIAPIMMVIVFFYWTVNVQNKMINIEPEPDVTIEVVGQQWQWTFNYGVGDPTGPATPNYDDNDYRYDDYVFTVGDGDTIPTLWLPVDQLVQFNLHSPDVIHDFGVPNFLMKMDVVPGRINKFQVTPTQIGTYEGKCYELCGVDHSRMLFKVKVVSQEDYDAHLADLAEQGDESTEPLLGGANVRTQAGLDDETEGGSE